MLLARSGLLPAFVQAGHQVIAIFDLGPLELIAAMLAAVAGAVVQGSIGFGMGLVLVPVLAIVAPAALPVTVVLLGMPVNILMSLREWPSIDRHGFAWIVAGRTAGTVLGVWLLLVVAGASLSVLFGVVIVAAVVTSIVSPTLRIRGRSLVIAGAISGVFATTAAIGGPPLALLYQHRPGPELRSTLAVTFGVGGLMTLAGLHVTGQTRLEQVVLALLLGIAVLVGLAISRRVARRLDARWLRPAVLTFAAVSGLYAVLRGLNG